jgi:hypothetical protein
MAQVGVPTVLDADDLRRLGCFGLGKAQFDSHAAVEGPESISCLVTIFGAE